MRSRCVAVHMMNVELWTLWPFRPINVASLLKPKVSPPSTRVHTQKHTFNPNPQPHLLRGPCQLNVSWWHHKPVNLSPPHVHTQCAYTLPDTSKTLHVTPSAMSFLHCLPPSPFLLISLPHFGPQFLLWSTSFSLRLSGTPIYPPTDS